MAVKARLEGHVYDLDSLVELFREGEPLVAVDDDGYYLESSHFDGLTEGGQKLFDQAANVLRRVMGVARILDSSFRPVSISGHFVVDDAEGVRHLIVVGDTVEVRSNAIVGVVEVGGVVSPTPPPEPLGPPYVQLSDSHPDVEEVLSILGKPSVALTWVDLYKVYEIVRHSVGDDKVLKGNGWAAPAEISAFTASANRPDVSGSQARHARMGGDSPKHTMTLAEGESLIRRLVVAWWNSLSPSV
ncbi:MULTISPECIES: hypothetical protein [Streptacidiphilus]|uniref:ESX secretion-associated protein EspG n=1 Tax=Streptacidiphilus cavernicola TaxID=3342716 RepID=A0ABV6UXC8_9ACTN|nr:hypothetical protein [Streptacidiphilus jeojiense]